MPISGTANLGFLNALTFNELPIESLGIRGEVTISSLLDSLCRLTRIHLAL
jgi:hypothetical protein